MGLDSGIYLISFFNTDWFYIGSSTRLKEREKEHLRELLIQKHGNKKLQNVFNKYPEDYCFEVIKYCLPEETRDLEQQYLDSFSPNLNICSLVEVPPTIKDRGNTFEILCPNNEIVTTNNLNAFCKNHNLDHSYFYKVSKGEALSHKGFKVITRNGKVNRKEKKKHKPRPKKKKEKIYMTKEEIHEKLIVSSLHRRKNYTFISPEGETFEIHGLAAFCREFNLDASNMSKVASGKLKSYRGWSTSKKGGTW